MNRSMGAALLLSMAALAGCMAYGPSGLSPGASIDQATASMGKPTGRYPNAGGGERIEFARGPAGLHTYMLDFDAQGRLQKSEQVLDENHFAAVTPGLSREDVLVRIGRPSNVMYLQWQKRQLWSYSYDSVFCQWFQVSLDTANRVVEAGYGPDPRCTLNRDDAR